MANAQPGVELPHVVNLAIAATRERVGDAPVAVVAEYPAHFPALGGDAQSLTDLLADLVQAAVERTGGEEVRVWVELLPAGERPVIRGRVVGDLAGLEEAGPWALVRVGFQAPEEGWQPPLDEARQARWQASVARAEGRLWYEQEGLAVTISLALPLLAAGANGEGPDVTALRQAVRSRIAPGGERAKRLLVMVAEKDLREALDRDLTRAGYEVVTTDRGEEVLGLARQIQPDLVLLDLLSRDPDAFEVAGVLKQDRRTRAIPVLFITSSEEEEGPVQMGAVGFMVRRAGTGALVQAVQTVLQSGLQPAARVLVAEPDDVARTGMVRMLQAYGYRVTEATGPEEALVLAERLTPGLILVNASLAKERDYWLLRGLRQVAQGAEIYVLAEAMDEAEAQAALRRGASAAGETGRLSDLLRRIQGGPGAT